MTTVNEIPFTSNPESFGTSLNGTAYTLTVKWNPFAEAWVLDIADNSGNALVSGIPIITGADLLAQYEYLGIGGKLIAQTDHDPNVVPTFQNLGSTGHLFYVLP